MMEKAEYAPVHQHEDDAESLQSNAPQPRCPSRRTFFTLVITNAITALAFLALLVYTIAPAPLNSLLKRSAFYSPILDRTSIPLETVQHDNTLWHETIYRQPPSPDVDAAWFDLATPRLYLASTEDIVRIGKDPELTVRHPTRLDKHVTMLSVDHQLHCLNELRQYIYHDYYNLSSPTQLQWDHTNHCIDLLRRALQCQPDVSLITYNWLDISPDPTPDFKVNTVCRNHESIRSLQRLPLEEGGFFNPVDEEGWPWHPTGKEKTIPAPRRWWEMLLEAGDVSEGEFERGKLDEGHGVLDKMKR